MFEKIVFLVLGILFYFSGYSQLKSDYQPRLNRYYVHENMTEWQTLTDSLIEEYNKGKVEAKPIIYMCYALSGYYIGRKKQKKPAEKYVYFGLDRIKEILDKDNSNPIDYSLLGTFYGLKIGVKNYLAPFLAPISFKYQRKSLKRDSTIAFTNVENANCYRYAPKYLGGNLPKAKRLYEKAIKTLESDENFKPQDWYYLNTLINYAACLKVMKLNNEARLVYKKILKHNPEFTFIKEKLFELPPSNNN